jgi:2-polyprenyl-3-methyl-5-hydroxy-6-metoxy-1,4-benzoquinol methylase
MNDLAIFAKIVDELIESAIYPDQKNYYLLHRNRYIFTLRELHACLSKHRFLEIGSSGFFLEALKGLNKSMKVYGTTYAESPGIEKKTSPFVNSEEFGYFLGNAEKHQYQIEPGYFDLVLCAEVIEHMTVDPMGFLSELNRVMCIGGYLLITTPNITSSRSIFRALNHEMPYNYHNFNKQLTADRHNIEYSPKLLASILNAAGFEVLKITTENVWSSPDVKMEQIYKIFGFDDGLRGDDIFLLAKKDSDVKVRYPDCLYD